MPLQNHSDDSALLVFDAGGNAIQYNPQAVALGLIPAEESSAAPVPANRLPAFLTEAFRTIHEASAHTASYQTIWARPGQLPGHFQIDSLRFPERAGVSGVPSARCLVVVRMLEAAETVGDGPLDVANPRPWYAARAHEMKNSLVAVKTLVDLVLEKDPGLGIAQIVRREIDRINSLVGQMLKSSAPEKPRFAWIQPHRIIQEVVRVTQPQLQDRAITLDVDLAAVGTDGEAEIWGDPHQIEQAVLNLVINGIEAMGSGGTLAIRTSIQSKLFPLLRGSEREPQPAFVVAVSDSGCGIPPEHRERLFDEFFTTKQGGTGLGLPITYQIVRAHRGFIEVKSRPAQGTTFELFFPLTVQTPT